MDTSSDDCATATEAAERDDPAKLVVINAKLHQVIYRAAHNQYLLQSLTTIVEQFERMASETVPPVSCNEKAPPPRLESTPRSPACEK